MEKISFIEYLTRLKILVLIYLIILNFPITPSVFGDKQFGIVELVWIGMVIIFLGWQLWYHYIYYSENISFINTYHLENIALELNLNFFEYLESPFSHHIGLVGYFNEYPVRVDIIKGKKNWCFELVALIDEKSIKTNPQKKASLKKM